MLGAGDFGQVGSPNHAAVSEWLRAKEGARAEAREEEHLHIARKALHHSRWATGIAIVAMLVSSIAARDQFIWLLKLLGVIKP